MYIEKDMDTRVMQAEKWSDWGGQKDIKAKIEQVDEWSEFDGYLYIMPATCPQSHSYSGR
jgi:hypothetical protein